MELTLKRLLENAEFKKYRGKGYDPAEVDDFVDKAAAMAAKVEVQLGQAMAASESAGAVPAPEDIQAEVERRVTQRLAEEANNAENRPPGAAEEEAAEEVRRTIIMAQRTADAAVREAREDAEKILASAKDQAETMVADAEARAAAINAEVDAHAASTKDEVEAEASRERREARQRLAAEIAEIEGTRESLRADATVLERHVEEQRTQLGSTLSELQQILDDPSGFRMAPPPPLADPDLPDFSDLDESDPASEDGLATGDAGLDEAAAEGATESAAAETVDIPPSAAPDAGAHQSVDQPGPHVGEPEAKAPPEPVGAADPPPDAAIGDAPDPAAEEGVVDAPTAPPQALSFGEVDHAAPGIDDLGPPTAPVSAVDLDLPAPQQADPAPVDEDPFLTELRKAMADDEPLGPRDDDGALPPSLFGQGEDDEDDRRRRFGRRR